MGVFLILISYVPTIASLVKYKLSTCRPRFPTTCSFCNGLSSAKMMSAVISSPVGSVTFVSIMSLPRHLVTNMSSPLVTQTSMKQNCSSEHSQAPPQSSIVGETDGDSSTRPSTEGVAVVSSVGNSDGSPEGMSDGKSEGKNSEGTPVVLEGVSEGAPVDPEGVLEGAVVGDVDVVSTAPEGACEGNCEGEPVDLERKSEGSIEKDAEGVSVALEGDPEGESDGALLDSEVACEGCVEGDSEGNFEGTTEGVSDSMLEGV